jgi:hypothetical protein
MQKGILILLLLLAGVFPLFSQTAVSEDRKEEPFSYIGMRLGDVFSRFGTPQSVYAARGDEHWQDDVVFVYAAGDFYVYRDRVWQVGLKSVFGINVGDVKAVALLVLGETARDEGDYLLYNIPGGGWPVSLRVNFSANRVSAIFVYRPDFQ